MPSHNSISLSRPLTALMCFPRSWSFTSVAALAMRPIQPPQTHGVNGHTGCRRSNQTKQTSGAAFPDPCSHTKAPLVFL
jgi:hypothetical protein